MGLASSMAPGHLALHVVLVRHGDLAGVRHTSCRLLRSMGSGMMVSVHRIVLSVSGGTTTVTSAGEWRG